MNVNKVHKIRFCAFMFHTAGGGVQTYPGGDRKGHKDHGAWTREVFGGDHRFDAYLSRERGQLIVFGLSCFLSFTICT